MARNKFINREDYRGFITENNLDDLVDEQRFPWKPWTTLKEFLGIAHDRAAKQKAKDIFCDMMQMVATDMIDDRAVFVFPKRNFGFMRIGDVSVDDREKKYFRRVENDFKVPGGMVYLDRLVTRVNGGKMYRFKMVGPLMRRLRENRFKGIQYVR